MKFTFNTRINAIIQWLSSRSIDYVDYDFTGTSLILFNDNGDILEMYTEKDLISIIEDFE